MHHDGAWIIPGYIATDTSLSVTARMLAGKINALTLGEKGYCWATDKYLAEQLGLSERSVRKYLGELREKKYLKSEIHTAPWGSERRTWLEPPEESDLTPPAGSCRTPPAGSCRPNNRKSERDGVKETESTSDLFGNTEQKTNGKPPKNWSDNPDFLELRAIAQRRVRSLPDAYKHYLKALKTHTHDQLLRARRACVAESGELKYVKFLDPWLSKQGYIADLEVADSLLGRADRKREPVRFYR